MGEPVDLGKKHVLLFIAETEHVNRHPSWNLTNTP